jgi:hypothetical protein
MTSEVTKFNGGALAQHQQAAAPMPKIMEDVLLAGDLAKLTPDQRVSFYGSLCHSLGLNPLTKPFDYLNLSGKLVPYAGKACAEQLRFQHGLTVRITARENIDGVYVVTAKATMPNGREDESTGAVSIKGISGDALAIAYMKAETKAKRRVTLSICGLGMMDESEVDSIRGAQRVPVDMETGAIDTGGHPVGTQAAANHVRDQKIAEMRERMGGQPAPAPAPPKPAGKSTDFAMLKAFKEIKAKIGSDAYYKILGANGYTKSDEITDTSKGRSIYAEMASCLKAQQERQADEQPAAEIVENESAEVWEAGRE